MNRALPALAVIMALTACDNAERPATDAASPESISIVDSVSAVEHRAVLTLEGEGLRVFDAESGSARPVPFGTSSSETIDIVSAVLAAAPREQGENADCGGSFATWEQGLGLWFVRDRLAGWAVRAGSDTLTTASGIGIGSTRSELESVYDAQVMRSSLGTEFTAGNIAGVLDSPAADGRVIAMWAGITCLAR